MYNEDNSLTSKHEITLDMLVQKKKKKKKKKKNQLSWNSLAITTRWQISNIFQLKV